MLLGRDNIPKLKTFFLSITIPPFYSTPTLSLILFQIIYFQYFNAKIFRDSTGLVYGDLWSWIIIQIQAQLSSKLEPKTIRMEVYYNTQQSDWFQLFSLDYRVFNLKKRKRVHTISTIQYNTILIFKRFARNGRN